MPRLRAKVLFLILLAGCDATVASGLDEQSANEIVVALDQANIGAEKLADQSQGGSSFSVRVPAGDSGRALLTLKNQGLPRESVHGFETVFESNSLVPTRTEEQARFVAATAGELSRSLESIHGVVRARVHIAPSEPANSLDGEPTPARASILIRHKKEQGTVSEDSVRKLVQGAVASLSADNVSVVLIPEAVNSAPSESMSKLGPISVSRGSLGTLKAIFAASLATNILLVAVLLWRLRR